MTTDEIDLQITIGTSQDVAVKYLLADMEVRYWEDGRINGEVDDDDDPKMPLVSGNSWILQIDLETGKVTNWPEGVEAKTHYKVCDAGCYKLLNEDMKVVAEAYGYVPRMLAIDSSGFGDYVTLTIDGTGQIQNWKADLSYFENQD